MFTRGLWLALVCLTATEPALSAQPAATNHVVLVTIDGLAAYYLADPQSPLPTLRRLAGEGALAETLRVSNPTATWPNHTTLVTGVHPDRHSVIFNGVVVRGQPGEPVRIVPDRTKNEMVAVPTLYDLLHRAGLRTAAVNWPCTSRAETLDDAFPDSPMLLSETTPRLRDELVRERILDPSDSDASLLRRSAAGMDQVWTAAAIHVLKVRRPQLLLLHLVATDSIQHRSGPRSPAAYAALGLADAQLANLVRGIESSEFRDQATLIVTSDHGFSKPTKMINPNAVLRKAGLLRPAPRRRAQSLSHGGTAFVYLTNPTTAREDRTNVVALLTGIEGIERILVPAEFAALRLPVPDVSAQAGDLLLIARPGYTFSNESFDDAPLTELPVSLGSHGYLASEPEMNGILVAWGRGIKAGAKLRRANNVDVAPTIAALFGESMPGVEGRVLRELLTEQAPP